MYLAWDYDHEENDINSMSSKGWQLVKGGMFHTTYQWDEQVYRYKLDFNTKVKFNTDEFSRYVDLFREQGWEYINSTLNGWHYFRKKYNPGEDEESYYLYTDDSSLKEMLGRWSYIARILQIIFLFYSFLRLFHYVESRRPYELFFLTMMLLGAALMQTGIATMKRKRLNPGTRDKRGAYFGYLLLSFFTVSVIATIFLEIHGFYIDKIDYTAQINQNTADYTGTLSVKRDGKYYLDVKCKSERGIAMISLKKGDTVLYNGGGGSFEVDDFSIHLKKGDYTVVVKYLLDDYKDEFPVTQEQLEDLHLTGDLNKMSKIKVLIGIK
jgi:hypothetical protein